MQECSELLFGHLSRPVNRNVGDMSNRPQGAPFASKDERVQINEQMALMFVIGGDASAPGQRLADPGGGEVLDAATNMDPRPEHDITAQEEIAGPQHGTGMDQPFLGVKG